MLQVVRIDITSSTLCSHHLANFANTHGRVNCHAGFLTPGSLAMHAWQGPAHLLREEAKPASRRLLRVSADVNVGRTKETKWLPLPPPQLRAPSHGLQGVGKGRIGERDSQPDE